MNPAPYELLCRHPGLFGESPLVVGTGANMPSEWIQLMRQHDGRLCTWDWMTHTQAQAAGVNSQFGIPGLDATQFPEPPATAILLWPKSKELALLMTRYLSSLVQRLWIVGANDAGGKSIGNACKRLDIPTSKVDAARHCSLWQADLHPDADQAAATDAIWDQSSKRFKANELEFLSYPGVFSHGQLDKGTALFLEVLSRELKNRPDRILDLGCGTGVIGLTLKQRFEQASITLADTDAIALHATRQNIQRLVPKTADIQVTASDRFSGISGRYQLIVTNPPFHTGTDTDYRFALDLFSKSKQHLTLHGQLWIVANRHLPYEEWATDYFGSGNVTLHQQAAGFKVLQINVSHQ